jgi:Zn finger protein HypA/HybF involved in hydrogenase expression
MGESTTFICEACGYESRPIRWGVSVEDPRRRAMPAHCMKCKAYVEVDLTGTDVMVDEFHCAQCDSEVFFVDRADSYGCPVCGSPGMKLRQGASYW